MVARILALTAQPVGRALRRWDFSPRMGDAPRVIDDDISRARTLPAAFYRDAATFEQVREKVFARSWQQVDGAERVRRRGAVLPFELLPGCVEEPLVLVRDEQGTLRCLSNVCTHRGNLVCTQAADVGGLRCGYHGRRFTLAGKMIAMPEFEGVHDFPAPRDDLKQLRARGRWARCALPGWIPRSPSRS